MTRDLHPSPRGLTGLDSERGTPARASGETAEVGACLICFFAKKERGHARAFATSPDVSAGQEYMLSGWQGAHHAPMFHFCVRRFISSSSETNIGLAEPSAAPDAPVFSARMKAGIGERSPSPDVCAAKCLRAQG